jgi:diguanylate cyclase (GGDEF)-like protein
MKPLPPVVSRLLLLGGGGAATLLVLLTGGVFSPLLPLLVAALVLLIRYEPDPRVLLAPPAVAGMLLLAGVRAGQGGGSTALGVMALLLAALPGLYWRRDARREAAPAAVDGQAEAAHWPRDADGPSAADEHADLERALAAVSARIGASSAVLWEVDGYHGKAWPRAASAGRPHQQVRLSGDPMGWAWENGMRMRMEQPPRWSEPGLAVVADRLRRHGDFGNMLTYAFEPGRMPADDLPFDETAVYFRGILAFQEARAEATADRRRLRTLLAGLTRTPGELDIESFAPELCSTAMDLVEGTGAAIGFWHGDHGTVLAAVGEDGGPRSGDHFAPPAAELALAVRADAMLVRSADGWSMGRTHVAHQAERWTSRPRALAALPLRTAHDTIGVLAVWTSRAPAFHPEWLELLHMMAPYAAIHLQHAVQYGSIKESAARDPLTMLRNRRAFEEVFTAETSRFERYGRPLSLMMLDLDHFKGINDRFGHEAGDEVLRRTARIIEDCVRDVDTAARVGGEEFVVLMPETGLGAALDAAERIRSSIAKATVDWRGTAIPVRVSAGVSSAPEIVATPAELMGSADTALYAAKAHGRNRVAAAG